MGDLVQRDFIRTADDGFALSMRLTSAPVPRLAVLVSSGTGYPKGFYDRMARWMARRGAAVLTYDFRGIAGSRPDDLKASPIDYPDWGRHDMPAALEALMESAPGVPVVHVGHSVGGHFIGLMPNHTAISRHALVSVGTGWWGGHLKRYRHLELAFWFLIGPYSLARHGYIKGSLWGGTDLPPRVFQTWRRWCHARDYFSADLDGPMAPHHYEAVTAPIRSWIFTDDPIATPQSGADLLRVYPNAPTSMEIIRPADLGVRRIGHDGAFRKGMEPLWEQIFHWLEHGEG